MQTAVLIQKAIQRQSAAKTRLPSPLAQFKVFLNRGAKKPSPEDKTETPPPPLEGEEKGETLPPPENEGGEGIDWEGGEPSGEPADAGASQDAPDAPADEAQGETAGDTPDAPAGEVSQDAPEPTQGASEDGADKTPSPAPEMPQGEKKGAFARNGRAMGARRRGR